MKRPAIHGEARVHVREPAEAGHGDIEEVQAPPLRRRDLLVAAVGSAALVGGVATSDSALADDPARLPSVDASRRHAASFDHVVPTLNAEMLGDLLLIGHCLQVSDQESLRLLDHPSWYQVN